MGGAGSRKCAHFHFFISAENSGRPYTRGHVCACDGAGIMRARAFMRAGAEAPACLRAATLIACALLLSAWS